MYCLFVAHLYSCILPIPRVYSPNDITDAKNRVDEYGIKLGTANCWYGKATLFRRVRERGNYWHGVNHTYIMAISGASTGGKMETIWCY